MELVRRDLLPAEFTAAMDDDLGVPAALAVIHETVSEGNRLLADPRSQGAKTAALLASVRGMLGVLGVDPLDPQWAEAHGDDAARAALTALVGDRLAARQAARAARDFATADTVRDSLKAAGILIEDTPSGPRWSLEG